MPFSSSAIQAVSLVADGGDLLVSWGSSAPPGACYQVYVDQRLAWYGAATRCRVPAPAAGPGRNTWVDVGTVGPGEECLDFSAALPSRGRGVGKATLSWAGGTYLDPTGLDGVQGFRVYQSPQPGAPVSFASPVAELAAYPGGWVSDGFGLGPFGSGGFGRAASSYSWTATGLTTGAWQFCVVPFDKSGNDRGAGQTLSVAVTAAPRPPAVGPSGTRLSAVYAGPGTGLVTLSWLPSPSA